MVYTGADSWDLKSLFVVPLAATVGALLLLQSLIGGAGGSGSGSGEAPSPSASAEPLVPSLPPAPSPTAKVPTALALGVVGVHGIAFGLAHCNAHHIACRSCKGTIAFVGEFPNTFFSCAI